MKKWIKIKLRTFLGIDRLENRISQLERSYLDRNTYQHAINEELKENIGDNRGEIAEINETIKNTLTLAMDVNQNKYDPTWCIIGYKKGGKDIVHHINLGNAHGDEIRDFLRRYEGCNKRIDSPMGWEMFK
jgi:hypothetical protein